MAYSYSYPSYSGGAAYRPQSYAPMQPDPMQMQMQMPQQPMQMQQEAFICRPVTSREEAIGAQVDYMRPTILPDLGHGAIFMKRFNPNTGASDFFEFALVTPEEREKAQFATKADIDELRAELERMKKSRRVKKEEPSDDAE